MADSTTGMITTETSTDVHSLLVCHTAGFAAHRRVRSVELKVAAAMESSWRLSSDEDAPIEVIRPLRRCNGLPVGDTQASQHGGTNERTQGV